MKGIGYDKSDTFEHNEKRQLEGVKLDKVFTDKESARSRDCKELSNMLNYIRESEMLHVRSMGRFR